MPDESFRPGNAGLTRLVKKIAKEKNARVGEMKCWNGYGYVVSEYYVRADILAEARATLARREEAKRLEAERRLQANREAERQRWQSDLASRFPRLSVPIPFPACTFGSWDEVPLGSWSKTQWRLLHCRLRPGATISDYLVLWRGARVIPLYSSFQCEWVRPRLHRSGEQLWIAYQNFGLDIAHAIWVTNRLVKIKADRTEKKLFYSIKDRFLNQHRDDLVEGRVARRETHECWACEGTGGDWCQECDGTGIYSERTLYEHRLRIGGHDYCFHSYTRPARLSNQPGADLDSYGRRFSTPELRAIPFGLPDHLRMLQFLFRT